MKSKIFHTFFWGTVLAGLLCGITAGTLLILTRDLPQIQSLENFKPSAVTRVYDADNVLLAEFYIEKRDPIPLAQIPEMLKIALLTTEDRHFYEHSGIAVKGILRAIVQNIRTRRFAQGASTLTQQLAKTLFLTPRKTLLRKLREAVLALQLERRYTKNEILTLYLNQVYLGSGAYGVASAARIYFDKQVGDLTVAQCALLAGLPKAPSRYSPLVNPALAEKRRNIVLEQMNTTGAIDSATYRQALKEPIASPPKTPVGQKANGFVNFIKERLVESMGADLLYKGGLTVHTTLSDRLQQSAESAVAQGLVQLEQRMREKGLASPAPQAALVALDIPTGAILAMVGGRDPGDNDYNRATTARRQPGSAFKPILFAQAIERGFPQYKTILDAPVVFNAIDSGGEDWQPENFSRTYAGEVSLRWALAHSRNIPAVRLMEKIGPSSVIQFAQDLGIRSKLKPNLSLALGTSEVTLMEITAAYAVFANQGKYISPYGVTEVVDANLNVIWRTKTEQHMAMSRSGAAIITDMLTAVIESGTGRGAGNLPGPLAGKTGTTNDFKDALFIGYAPRIASGVWVGNDDGSPLGAGETGARAALPIWTQFMDTAMEDQPQQYFDLPEDVIRKSIDPRTGAPLPPSNREAVQVLVRRTQQRIR